MRGSNNFVYKISKVPIICICNDAWCQKLRSLKDTHCMHIAFHKPTKQQIRVRMINIASREGLQALMCDFLTSFFDSCIGKRHCNGGVDRQLQV